jgi:hypothetical protein
MLIVKVIPLILFIVIAICMAYILINKKEFFVAEYVSVLEKNQLLMSLWRWVLGHMLPAFFSIFFVVIYLFTHAGFQPRLKLIPIAIAITTAFIYDFIFNLFQKIPARIIHQKFNHWIRTIFIMSNALFLIIIFSLY